MSTYDTTCAMLGELQENEQIKVQAYITRILKFRSQERMDPTVPLSKDMIYEQLATAREHAAQRKVMEARQASENVRHRYGLS